MFGVLYISYRSFFKFSQQNRYVPCYPPLFLLFMDYASFAILVSVLFNFDDLPHVDHA